MTPASARTRRAVMVSACIAVALLAGCARTDAGPAGGSSTPSAAASSSSATAGDRTDADVMFSVMMVPHHLQAIEMADLVPSRSRTPEVVSLAQRVKDAQAGEVEQMTRWLGGWDADPALGHDELADHSGHEGDDGMLTPDDLRELGALSGPAFDRRWLELMVQHHEGAVAMAQEVLRTGRHAPTRDLARQVVASQQAEIEQMRALLSR